jgi:hypothetical protein
MKITTIALASALAMSSSLAFAQAGEGDANFAGSAQMSGGGYGASGFSSAYGAMVHFGRIGRNPHGHRKPERRD